MQCFPLFLKKLNLHSRYVFILGSSKNVLLCFLSSLRAAEHARAHTKNQNLRGWVCQPIFGEVWFRYLYVYGDFSTTRESRIAWQITQKELAQKLRFGHKMYFSMPETMEQTQKYFLIFTRFWDENRFLHISPKQPQIRSGVPKISAVYFVTTHAIWYLLVPIENTCKNLTPVQIWASKLFSSSLWSVFSVLGH